MPNEARGLDHFVNNPQDLDINDPEVLERVLKEMSGEAPGAPAEPEKPAAAAEPAAKADPPAAPAKVEAPAAQAAVVAEAKEGTAVLAPDGKSTIPYAVLQKERQGRATAEAAVSEQAAEIVALGERLKALEAGDKAAPGEADEITAQIEALKDEAPAVAEALERIMDGINAKLASLSDKQSTFEKSQQETEAEAQARVNREVQEAVDSNPALVHWRENNPELWTQAAAFDKTLREQSEWSDKPFSERFDKVVKLVVAMHDESVLPPAAAAGAAPAKAAAGLSAAAVKQAAEAKLKEAAPPVTTLTDIPGGTPAEQNESERVENMSTVALGAKFENMDAKQLQAYLASIG